MTGSDTMILVVGALVTLVAVWAAVVYFLLLFRERFDEVDQTQVEVIATSPDVRPETGSAR